DLRKAPAGVSALLVDGVDTETAPCALGGVHGDVRSAHQRISVIGVLGEDRDADADVDVDRLVVDSEGRIHRLEDLFRDHDRARHISRAPWDDRELIPAVTGDRVGLAKHMSYPLTDLLQQPIAGFVSQAIVHGLETVKIEKQDSAWFHLSLPRTDGF